MDFIDEIFDEFGLEVVVVSGFAGAEFDGDVSIELDAHGVVDFDHGLGGNFGGHVDDGFFFLWCVHDLILVVWG